MARKNQLTASSGWDSEFNVTKEYFDGLWYERYGHPLHDWLVNMAKTPRDLRRLASFLMPSVCEKVGNEIRFFDDKNGQKCKDIMQNLFMGYLEEFGLKIYEKPEVESTYKWHMMDDKQKIGFAKSVWAKRDYVGRFNNPKIPFDDEVKEKLCLVIGAPNPYELCEWLYQNDIDVDALEAK